MSFYPPTVLEATITAGSADSAPVNVHGLQLLDILSPTAWDAANLSFFGSFDGSNFFILNASSGTPIQIATLTASRIYRLDAAGLGVLPMGITRLRLRSGAPGSPVNQTANRLIRIAARQVS